MDIQLPEARCDSCGLLLGYILGVAQIKCRKCSTVNNIYPAMPDKTGMVSALSSASGIIPLKNTSATERLNKEAFKDVKK